MAIRCHNCADRVLYEAQQFQVKVYRHGGSVESYRFCSIECMGFWVDARRGMRSEG